MLTAHEQLVAALRAIVAQTDDPQALIDVALRDAKRETPAFPAKPGDAAPGPYTPNAWSMYTPRTR